MHQFERFKFKKDFRLQTVNLNHKRLHILILH